MSASRRLNHAILLHARRNDLELAIGQRTLQLQSRQPRLDIGRICEDPGHRLGMYGHNDVIRRNRQEAKEIIRRLTFLDLPDRVPVRPDAGEEGEGACLIERKLDVAAMRLAEFAEGREGHDAAVLNTELALPVFAVGVANVCYAAIRLHAKQFLEAN